MLICSSIASTEHSLRTGVDLVEDTECEVHLYHDMKLTFAEWIKIPTQLMALSI